MPIARAPPRLDRSWIEAHIPHQGEMCLLDEIVRWDESQAQCRASSHRSPANPLRAFSRLGAACGIEYAAQAMAVHGALMACTRGGGTRPGFLASVRGVQLHVQRLDQIRSDLLACVERVSADERTAIYAFSLRADEQVLVSGRAAIAFLELTPAGVP